MKVQIRFGGKSGPAAPATDDPESLKAPLSASVVFHSMIFAVALFGGALVPPHHGQQWGEAGFGGGRSVPVNLSPSVPLTRTVGPRNPVAADTQELHPAQPEPPKKVPPASPAREFQLSERDWKKKLAELERRQASKELAQLRGELPEGAIPGTTSSGRASSPMYGMATGQGAGGIGFGGQFGVLYGWYVRAVRGCIARHWDRGRVDPAIRSAPRVYVEFNILRDGTMGGERITTSSSIPSIDREALRAVQACSGRRDVGADAHLPELPRDYPGSSVHVEVWFEFRK